MKVEGLSMSMRARDDLVELSMRDRVAKVDFWLHDHCVKLKDEDQNLKQKQRQKPWKSW